MKQLLSILIVTLLYVGCVKTQTPFPKNWDFNSIGQIGDDWKQVLGPTGNTGSHGGLMCFNISGNYIDNQYYSFESDTLDLQLWSEVEMVFTVQQNLRNGDLLGLYYLDGTTMTWSGWDLSGANGTYTLSIPTTAILFSVDLNTDANGNVNGKYAHVDYIYLSDPGGTPLPVTLLEFNGHAHDNCNHLNWSTASEANSDYFEIEHSLDANQWTSVDKVSAAGNSNMTLGYSLIHESPKNAINYYRLVQYDWDGVFEIFGPISIDNRKKEKRIVKYVSLSGQEIDPKSTIGLVIGIYEDGTTIKVYLQ
jgi:hypothetical protein